MAKKAAMAKACNCIDQVNDQLKPEGFRVRRCFTINVATQRAGMGPPELVVERCGKPSRKKIPSILCSFCPVCGTKYPE